MTHTPTATTTATTKAPARIFGHLAFIVPFACVVTHLLSFILQKLSALLSGSSAPITIISAIALFFGSVLINMCTSLQPKGKMRGIVMGICSCPLALRAIGACALAFFGTYLAGFWLSNLASFVSREMNVTAVLLSAGMHLASRKKTAAAVAAQEETTSPEPAVPVAQEPTLEELSEELGEEFSADVADELDFTDDEVLP